jgi:hypothetical protein
VRLRSHIEYIDKLFRNWRCASSRSRDVTQSDRSTLDSCYSKMVDELPERDREKCLYQVTSDYAQNNFHEILDRVS